MAENTVPIFSWRSILDGSTSAEDLATGMMTNYGYVFVELPSHEHDELNAAMSTIETFFSTGSEEMKLKIAGTSKFGYKRLLQKQRYQFRNCGSSKLIISPGLVEPGAPLSFEFPSHFTAADPTLQSALRETEQLFKHVALVTLSRILVGMNIDPAQALTEFCDESNLAPTKASMSVLNCYQYLNTDEKLGNSNCNEHTDPGFITVLAKATQPGLEMMHTAHNTARCSGVSGYHGVVSTSVTNKSASVTNISTSVANVSISVMNKSTIVSNESINDIDTNNITELENNTADANVSQTKDDRTDDGDDDGDVDELEGKTQHTWMLAEPLMKSNYVAVLAGESLRRLTDGKLPACLHRVVGNHGNLPRTNVIFELRPQKNVFAAWDKLTAREN
eukprot:m.104873 g.104873  ORF g.104873 m.104873 type:complete len:391 (+) comp27600_c0_seq1:308-1480(+)